MTLPQVKAVVEHHLSTQMHNPQVSVDVLAYNSKKIYEAVSKPFEDSFSRQAR